jgi:CheY-like chemotaxis protein
MSGAHILVVDDEPVLRRTLQANLGLRGYDVTAVETGEAVRQQVGVQVPDEDAQPTASPTSTTTLHVPR